VTDPVAADGVTCAVNVTDASTVVEVVDTLRDVVLDVVPMAVTVMETALEVLAA
jgi:hypothetical protein